MSANIKAAVKKNKVAAMSHGDIPCPWKLRMMTAISAAAAASKNPPAHRNPKYKGMSEKPVIPRKNSRHGFMLRNKGNFVFPAYRASRS
jgi:hypothetical protein